ncbi:MAG: SDR family oxidoreductase [bacterium]
MKYLVTGGGGFIGSHIVEFLVRRGDEVRVIDDFSTGRRENLEGFVDRIELIEGSLVNEGFVREAAAGVEVVLHQGAIPSVPRSHHDPAATSEANVRGTLNVLVAARDAGVRRVVVASSSSTYGDSEKLPKRETDPPNPKSIYAATKLAGEHYAMVFAEIFALPVICLRYFNIFGPRQDPASQYAAVIPKFITSIAGNEPPVIFGDGTQSRDFTYIENAVRANYLAATVEHFPSGEVCNIACGQRYSLLQLVETINNILGKDVKPQFAPPRPGDVKHSQADISKAKKLLGYEPVISFEEGLRRTIDFFAGKTL